MSVTSGQKRLCDLIEGDAGTDLDDLFRFRARLRRELVPEHRPAVGRDRVTDFVNPGRSDGGRTFDRSVRREFSCGEQLDVRSARAASRCRNHRRAGDRDRREPFPRADAVFGVLHANLGAIAAPKAWLVVLVGPGFVPQAGLPPSPSPNLAAASFAQAQNFYFVYAVVEATGGSMIMAGGS